MEQAMNAKTRGDLSSLFTDLPETGAPAARGSAATDHPYRRHGHPVLMLVLFVIVASAFAHLLWWTAGPIIWLAFLVFAVLFASRTIGRAHQRRPDDRWL
jgi:protein-S-isoprenylcysteine O-methyltransferase Ste14